jgi:phytoene dehydrogenase-like protein
LEREESYDAVVIGSGLGGLLAAARIAKAGGRVLVAERLPRAGGRFTTYPQDGCEIATGALHLVPHGGTGVLAQELAGLGLPWEFVRRDALASFHARGRHRIWWRRGGVAGLFGWRANLDLARIAARLKWGRPGPEVEEDSFGAWIRGQTRDALVRALFERFCEFALSISAEQLTFREMREVIHCVLRYGLPAVPSGGCRAVVEGLCKFVEDRGGTIATSTQAVAIRCTPTPRRVRGVELRSRRSEATTEIAAGRVVSDVGPKETAKLLERDCPDLQLASDAREAAGMKLHVLSPRSLIPHNGILFCLDTQRISGIVQVSNAVPALAPADMHLLDTFQVLKSDDIARERALALEDLRQVFGAGFERCRLIGSSAFRGPWPVNRLPQGADEQNQEPVPGLLLVGDAYKPSGHMMVEGVAGSVRRIARRLETAP